MTAAVKLDPVKMFNFRLGEKLDHAFVRDSWLKSQWAADMRHKMPRGEYSRAQGERIDKLLVRSMLIVVCAPKVPAQVCGWMLFEPMRVGGAMVHWLYVKHAFRRLGVAAAMLGQLVKSMPGALVHTHKGDARCVKLAARFGAQFNPYLAEA